MKKPKGSATFVENDLEFLWLAMIARSFGTPPSQRLGIKDEVLALDFDRAAALRLLEFDNEKDEANRKFWVALVGGESKDGGEYVDAETATW